jgi:hypothetical protein
MPSFHFVYVFQSTICILKGLITVLQLLLQTRYVTLFPLKVLMFRRRRVLPLIYHSNLLSLYWILSAEKTSPLAMGNCCGYIHFLMWGFCVTDYQFHVLLDLFCCYLLLPVAPQRWKKVILLKSISSLPAVFRVCIKKSNTAPYKTSPFRRHETWERAQ